MYSRSSLTTTLGKEEDERRQSNLLQLLAALQPTACSACSSSTREGFTQLAVATTTASVLVSARSSLAGAAAASFALSSAARVRCVHSVASVRLFERAPPGAPFTRALPCLHCTASSACHRSLHRAWIAPRRLHAPTNASVRAGARQAHHTPCLLSARPERGAPQLSSCRAIGTLCVQPKRMAARVHLLAPRSFGLRGTRAFRAPWHCFTQACRQAPCPSAPLTARTWQRCGAIYALMCAKY